MPRNEKTDERYVEETERERVRGGEEDEAEETRSAQGLGVP